MLDDIIQDLKSLQDELNIENIDDINQHIGQQKVIDLDEYNATSSHQNIMYKGHIIETSPLAWNAFIKGFGTYYRKYVVKK